MNEFNPCDICIDEPCKGEKNCDCDNCEKKEECPRKLSATIRITMQCTQSCGHCCFECSPETKTHMSTEQAEKVSRFLRNNHFHYANVMGGEFFIWLKLKVFI